MAKAKSWTYTDLSADDTMYLKIEGDIYEVVQFTSSFAVNEIPRATLLLAVGRDARSAGAATSATINQKASSLKQMTKATVYFSPKGEWDASGREWPADAEIIFDGYYVGMGHRKISGKVQAVMHLVHWLVDLTFSSTLSKNMHPANPTSLVFPAVVPSTQGAGAGSQPIFVSHHVGHESIVGKVETDLWAGIKTMLCELAEINRIELVCDDSGLGPGDLKKNDKALDALSRIQGPSEKCDKAYDKFGKPLKLDTNGIPFVAEAVADSVTQQTLESFANITFWDTIVGQYCPMFNMAVIPRVTDALIVADTPALQWAQSMKTLTPEEHDGLDQTAMLTRPLQAVGVYGDYESLTGWEKTETAKGGQICIGGHFAADAMANSDGMFLVVKSPPWLRSVVHAGVFAGSTTGVKLQEASHTATTDDDVPDPPPETPGTILPRLRELYNKYARTVYVANMLRGRSSSISGKLRFDIAPGSIIKIEPTPEQFLSGVDQLAVDMYAHVTRVTISINAEASLAGTSFQLSHLRSAEENTNQRTMVTEHPLFGADIYKGAPLINAWEFP